MAQTGTNSNFNSGFDSGLLNRDELNKDEQTKAASQLREGRRSPSAGSAGSPQDSLGQADEGGEGGDETGAAGEPQSLRQRVMAARQVMNLKKLAKKKIEEKVTAPAKQFLSELLKDSWLNLIDSFGLTLIWINIHVFLKWTLGEKLFCKLGEEWLPKQVTQAGGDAAETAGKGIGLIEVMVLLILDLIVLAVILGALALIVMIVNFMGKSWWGKLEALWEAISTLGWGGISALVDLFAK